MRQHFELWEWGLIGVVAVDCLLKLLVAVAIFEPTLAPDWHFIKNVMKVPEMVFGGLIITLPCLVAISVPRFRSSEGFYLVAGVFYTEAMFQFIFDLSVNGIGAAMVAYIFAGNLLVWKARAERAQQVAEPDAGERNASSCRGSGAG